MRNGGVWDLMGETIGVYRDFEQNARDCRSKMRWIIMRMQSGRSRSSKRATPENFSSIRDMRHSAVATIAPMK